MQQRSEDNGHSSEALVDLTETQTPLPRLCPGPLSETCSRERDAAARSLGVRVRDTELPASLLCNPGPA